MFKKVSAILLSASLLFAQAAVSAQPGTSASEGFCTDRYIIETRDSGASTYSRTAAAVSKGDMQAAVADILHDMDAAAAGAEVAVTTIADNTSALVLPEAVNADAFMQAVEDQMDGTVVSIQPDYPVYLASGTAAAAETDTAEEETVSVWEENLARAQTLSTGEGARIAIIGGNMDTYASDFTGVFVDEYYLTDGSYNGVIYQTDMQTAAIIHMVAPDAKIIPITALSADREYAYTSDLVAAIQYAREKGANAVVCNWYTTQYNAYLEAHMESSGLLFITAAGTYSGDYGVTANLDEGPVYPACFAVENQIAAAAINEDYSRYMGAAYGSPVDIYAWGDSIPCSATYATLSGPEAAVAMVAGAAALVVSRNNGSAGLRNQLLQSAATVSYMPGTEDYESYKALDFYDAVMGTTSAKEIVLSTPSGDEWIGSETGVELRGTYYAEIAQIAGGRDVMAVLLTDGTVKLQYIMSGMPGAGVNPFYPTDFSMSYSYESNSMYCSAVETDLGLSNIKQVAVTPDGYGFMAVAENGDLYVWGKKSSLGLGTDETVVPLGKSDAISGVDSVYLTGGTAWVQLQADAEGHKKVYSVGSLLCRSGDAYTFAEVPEAADAAQIALSGMGVILVKDGNVYTSAGSIAAGDLYFTAVDGLGESVSAVHIDASNFYALDVNGNVWKWNTASPVPAMIASGVTDMTCGSEVMILEYTEPMHNTVNYTIISNGNMQSVQGLVSYHESGVETADIEAICSVQTMGMFGTIVNVLDGEGTLYRLMGNAVSFEPIARKSFGAKALHSVSSIRRTMQYTTNAEELEPLEYILRQKLTVTLEDGTDVIVPVTWSDTDSYDPLRLGTQRFYGDLSLPVGIANPENLWAEASITIKVAITAVVNSTASVSYGATVSELEEQLATEVNVILANGGDDTLPVTWDTSAYNPNQSGEQRIYGTLTLTDNISNPNGERAMAVVIVGEEPPKEIAEVNPVVDITVPYNTAQTDLPLPPEVTVNLDDGSSAVVGVAWAPYAGYSPTLVGTAQRFTGTLVIDEADNISNPEGHKAYINVLVAAEVTGNIVSAAVEYVSAGQSIPLDYVPAMPSTVTVTVEGGGTASLPVSWDAAAYDPERIGVRQQVRGTIAATDRITNTNNVQAFALVLVSAAEYDVEAVTGTSTEITVEYGTTLAEVAAQYGAAMLRLKNRATEEMLEIPVEISLFAADNAAYQPETPGAYSLLARPVLKNNMHDEAGKTISFQVTVKDQRTITGVANPAYSTYRYTMWSSLELPETVDVSLDDGTTVSLGVTWDEASYNSSTVGSSLISGEFDALPVSVNNDGTLAPVIIMQILDAAYTVTDVAYSDIETVPAGLTLEELYTRLSAQTVLVQITTEDGSYSTGIELPFTLDAENTDYNGEEMNFYIIPAVLQLPAGISNPDAWYYEVWVDVVPADIVAEDNAVTVSHTVTRGTAFENLGLPEAITVTAETGKTYAVPVTWNANDYSPEAEGVCTVSGEGSWPDYLNGYDIEFFCRISFVEPDNTFTVLSVSPDVLPAGGALSVKLGSTLSEIQALLETDTVTVTVTDAGGAVSTREVGFRLRDEDNSSYLSAAAVGTHALTAALVLPADIVNPDGITLTVNVETYKKTVKSIATARVTGVAQGTAFADIAMPETVTVTFTDNTTEAVPVTWDGSSFVPSKTGSQRVTGTLNAPVYIDVNGKTANAVISVTAASAAQILAVTPMNRETVSLLGIGAQNTDLPEDLIAHSYIVEYLLEDGTTVTEEIVMYTIID